MKKKKANLHQVDAVVMKKLFSFKVLALRDHYHCEDCWYSCPKSEDGCCNEFIKKDECNCGAEEHNEKVEKLWNEIFNSLSSQLYPASLNRILKTEEGEWQGVNIIDA